VSKHGWNAVATQPNRDINKYTVTHVHTNLSCVGSVKGCALLVVSSSGSTTTAAVRVSSGSQQPSGTVIIVTAVIVTAVLVTAVFITAVTVAECGVLCSACSVVLR
jgi:hypothetical protein